MTSSRLSIFYSQVFIHHAHTVRDDNCLKFPFHFSFSHEKTAQQGRENFMSIIISLHFSSKSNPGSSESMSIKSFSNFINFISKNKLWLAGDADGVRMLFISLYNCVKFTPTAIKNAELNANQCRVIVRCFFFLRFSNWGGIHNGELIQKVLKWVRLKNKPANESWEFFVKREAFGCLHVRD